MQFVDVEPGTEAPRDLSVDTGIRKHIEAAIAHHRPAPDADLIEQNVAEGRAAIRRASNDGKEVKEFADLRPDDRRRLQIRSAVTEEKIRAANTPPAEKFVQDGPQKFIHNQPPATWDAQAKAEWDKLPEKVRLAALREQNETMNSLGPIVSKYAEIEKAIAPARPVYQNCGIKDDAEAIKRLFAWEAYLRANPKQAVEEIARQYGVTSPYQQPEPTDAEAYAVEQTLAKFAQDKPHFQSVRGLMGQILTANPNGFTAPNGEVDLNRLYDAALQYASQPSRQEDPVLREKLAKFAESRPYFKAVRRTMGALLTAHPGKYGPTGQEDLQKLYDDACRVDGIVKDKKSNKREAPVSPSSRSPSAAPVSKTEKGASIRSAIRNAISESRGHL